MLGKKTHWRHKLDRDRRRRIRRPRRRPLYAIHLARLLVIYVHVWITRRTYVQWTLRCVSSFLKTKVKHWNCLCVCIICRSITVKIQRKVVAQSIAPAQRWYIVLYSIYVYILYKQINWRFADQLALWFVCDWRKRTKKNNARVQPQDKLTPISRATRDRHRENTIWKISWSKANNSIGAIAIVFCYVTVSFRDFVMKRLWSYVQDLCLIMRQQSAQKVQ